MQATRKVPYTLTIYSAKTGKEISPSKAKGEVYYAVKKGRGKARILSQAPQTFTKKDYQGIAKAVENSDGNFVLYEELTRQVQRDKNGKTIYRTRRDPRRKKRVPVLDDSGKPIPLRTTKLTFAQQSRAQKPVLFKGPRRIRELDIGFKSRTKKDIVDNHLLTVVAPNNKWSKEISINGETIKDTVKNIKTDLTMREVKRNKIDGVFFETVLRIKGHKPMLIHGRCDTLANFSDDVSKAIRYHLADRGLRFTSLFKLQEIAQEQVDIAESPDASDDDKSAATQAAHSILRPTKLRVPVDKLNPIVPENEFGYDAVPSRDGYLSMQIRVQGFRAPKVVDPTKPTTKKGRKK